MVEIRFPQVWGLVIFESDHFGMISIFALVPFLSTIHICDKFTHIFTLTGPVYLGKLVLDSCEQDKLVQGYPNPGTPVRISIENYGVQEWNFAKRE